MGVLYIWVRETTSIMAKKKNEQSNQDMSPLEVGRKFLAEFDKMPYSEDRLGQSFITTFKKPPKKK